MGKTYKIGPWTPDNNEQHVDAVNTCSCSYCGAKPGEWCLTKSKYIAQAEHRDRREAYQKRAGKPMAPAPEWLPVVPAMSRIVTIEVVMPRDHETQHDKMIDSALSTLRAGEGFAAVTGSIHVEQTMEEATEILKRRSIDL